MEPDVIKLISLIVTTIVVPLLGMMGLLVRAVIKSGSSAKLVAESMAPVAEALKNIAAAVSEGTTETLGVKRRVESLEKMHEDENSIFATKDVTKRVEELQKTATEIRGAVTRIEGKISA